MKPTGHIRDRYSPRMTAAEKRHQAHVQQQLCFGCGRYGCSAHHWMGLFQGKTRRREHKWLLGVCQECHQGKNGIHGIGSEAKWLESIGRTQAEAIAEMETLWAESQIMEAQRG